MPNRILVLGFALLLIGYAINGVRTGSVRGRIGRVERDGNPLWFWCRVALYIVLGVLALGYAWSQYPERVPQKNSDNPGQPAVTRFFGEQPAAVLDWAGSATLPG
jgi:hypothetical protein